MCLVGGSLLDCPSFSSSQAQTSSMLTALVLSTQQMEPIMLEYLPNADVILFHENLDTVQPLCFLTPSLPKCIKPKVKWYQT